LKNLDSSLHPPDDQDQNEPFIRRARAGDREAFGRLYTRYAPQVHAFISARVGNELTADDIAAETWEAAWRSIEQFTGGQDQFVPWVTGIARHRALTHIKQRKQHDSLDEAGEDGEVRFRGGTTKSAVSPPDAEVLGRDELERVSRALEALPPRRREALLLRARDGLSEAEVAESLGVTPTAAHWLLHRGRRQLRAAVARTRSAGRRDGASPTRRSAESVPPAADPAALSPLWSDVAWVLARASQRRDAQEKTADKNAPDRLR
jgi:RNA polymerase sigma-70 factor, ECF subfamily